MKITFIWPQRKSDRYCNIWRGKNLLKAINHTGRHQAWFLSKEEFAANSYQSRQLCTKSDVLVILQELWGNNILAMIQHWQARNKMVIFDCFEASHLLSSDDPDYLFWFEGKLKDSQGIESPAPITQLKWGAQIVNGITTSSQMLTDDWIPFNLTSYIPSYVDMDLIRNIQPVEHEDTVLGWRGDLERFKAFRQSGAYEAIMEITQSRPNVKLWLYSPDIACSDLPDIPQEQVEVFSPLDTSWETLLASIDVGLAPLSGEYDNRIGRELILEFLSMKIPWVASHGPAYYALKNYGWLVENKPGAWCRVLSDMVEHFNDHRLEATHEPYLFALSQSIDENIQQVVDSYVKINQQQMNHSSTSVVNQMLIRS